MPITVAARFTQNSGQPATGLTLADISIRLSAYHKTTGIETVIWTNQNPTTEISNQGAYAVLYSGENLNVYDYIAMAQYTGGATLDIDYAYGSISRDIGLASSGGVIPTYVGTDGRFTAVDTFVFANGVPFSDNVLDGQILRVNEGTYGGFTARIMSSLDIGGGDMALTLDRDASPLDPTTNLDFEILGDYDQNTLGTLPYTYTITNSVTSAPIDGVRVDFATDAAGQYVVWTGFTDAFGVARDQAGNLPRLDPGTYYIYRQKAGFTFADPDTEVVS